MLRPESGRGPDLFAALRPFHLAARHTELIEQLQLAPKVRSGNFAAQQLPIFLDQVRNLFGPFVYKLNPEMTQPQSEQMADILGAGLRSRVENGVTAADVSLERVFGSDSIAQAHLMFVAWPPAIGVIGSFRKKGAEDTMLHVKHGHMLVDGDFVPIGRRTAEQCLKL